MFRGSIFIWVIYYVVIIELLKNMNTKEQNTHSSNYAGITSMFINPVSARNGNAQSSGVFVFGFLLIIQSCSLITEEATVVAVCCSK